MQEYWYDFFLDGKSFTALVYFYTHFNHILVQEKSALSKMRAPYSRVSE